DSIPLLPYLKVGLWALLLGALFLYAHRRHPFPRETRWFIAFLALLALSVPFALTPRNTFMTTWTLIMMMVAGPFVMMTSLDTVRKLRVALWAYCVASTWQCVAGILAEGRGTGYFIDENDLCMLAATVIPIAFYLAVTAHGLTPKLLGFT